MFLLQSYIPKTLDHVKNAEEDVQRITSGTDTGDMYYQTITGLKQALSISDPSLAEKQSHKQSWQSVEDNSSVPNEHPDSPISDASAGTDEDDSDSTGTEEGESSSEGGHPTAADRKAARKENKKKVKEEKREARKHKVPKAVKKKKKKLAKAKKYR